MGGLLLLLLLNVFFNNNDSWFTMCDSLAVPPMYYESALSARIGILGLSASEFNNYTQAAKGIAIQCGGVVAV